MKKWVSTLMAAVFMLSFSSVALASNGVEVSKTYKFDKKWYKVAHHNDFKYHHLKNKDSYKDYLEFKQRHKNVRLTYKEYLKWLELLEEKNYSFGNVYLQGYQNGVAIYR